MFPKGTVPEKQTKKETMVYIVGEKDVQVALKRASRTEVKRAMICACAVVVTTLILVGGTLGAITLWLSYHHTTHDGHFDLSNGKYGHVEISPTSGGRNNEDGHTPVEDKGHDDVTEAFTDVPGVATDAGEIVIDDGDRGSSQSPTTQQPTQKQTKEITPSVVQTKSSLWESFSVPLYSYDYSSDDESSFDPEVVSGSGSIPDEVSEDYAEIPYRPSADSDYSTFEPSYDTASDPDMEGTSGSGSGDEEISGDYFVGDFQDTLQVVKEDREPKITTPQEFTVLRYPIPVADYHTLCTPKSCTIGYTMEGEGGVQVVETDLQMRPQKLTILKSDGSKVFTIIRDEIQGYRAILLEENGMCLLARLEDMQNLKIRRNSAQLIFEQLRVTLSVELPEQLVGQIGGPIMDACRHVPVFWAQQIGDENDISIINRLKRSVPLSRGDIPPSRGDIPPSRGDGQWDGLSMVPGIHFQCCWCPDEADPCPCECGFF